MEIINEDGVRVKTENPHAYEALPGSGLCVVCGGIRLAPWHDPKWAMEMALRQVRQKGTIKADVKRLGRQIRFDPELMERIDTFRYANRIPSRMAAIRWMVVQALDLGLQYDGWKKGLGDVGK